MIFPLGPLLLGVHNIETNHGCLKLPSSQGTLSKREGSVQLTSSVWWVVLSKRNIKLQYKISWSGSVSTRRSSVLILPFCENSLIKVYYSEPVPFSFESLFLCSHDNFPIVETNGLAYYSKFQITLKSWW